VTEPKADPAANTNKPASKPEFVDLSSPAEELSDAELASVAGGVISSEAPAAIDIYSSTDLLLA
jgi:hypothetical protein